jgi:hypothetical protein
MFKDSLFLSLLGECHVNIPHFKGRHNGLGVMGSCYYLQTSLYRSSKAGTKL